MTQSAPKVQLHPRQPLRLLQLVLITAFLCLHSNSISLAADSPPKSEEIRHQTAEIERLQQELEKTRQNLGELQNTPAPNPEAQAEIQHPPPPEPSLETAIQAHQLAHLFLSSPKEAANRYKGKTFRIQGSVEDFDQKRFVRSFFLLLSTDNPDIDLHCQFSYVNDHRKVYADKRERQLLGESPNGVARVLASKGQLVTIQGKCLGLKGETLEFKDCSVIQ
ncbi:MAG: OB-fold protein [Limisphaerales bacterium]